MQRALYNRLQECVVKPYNYKRPEISVGLALSAVLLCGGCLTAYIGCLLIFISPQTPVESTIVTVNGGDDIQNKLAHCSNFTDVTEYGKDGLDVGELPGIGQLYLRGYIHSSDLENQVMTLYCSSSVPEGGMAFYVNYHSYKILGESLGSVCLPLDATRKNALLYVIGMDVPTVCERLLTLIRSGYERLQAETGAWNSPDIAGIECGAKRDTDEGNNFLMGLTFVWPLQPELGAFMMDVGTFCDGRWPHAFPNNATYPWSHTFAVPDIEWDDGDAEEEEEDEQYEAHVTHDEDQGSETTGVTGRVESLGTHGVIVGGPKPACAFAGMHNFAPHGCDGKFDSTEWDVSFVQKYFEFHFTKLPLWILRDVCPGSALPIGQDLRMSGVSVHRIFRSVSKSYRSTEFRFLCNVEKDPGLVSRISHVWPFINVAVSLTIAHGLIIVYKVLSILMCREAPKFGTNDEGEALGLEARKQFDNVEENLEPPEVPKTIKTDLFNEASASSSTAAGSERRKHSSQKDSDVSSVGDTHLKLAVDGLQRQLMELTERLLQHERNIQSRMDSIERRVEDMCSSQISRNIADMEKQDARLEALLKQSERSLRQRVTCLQHDVMVLRACQNEREPQVEGNAAKSEDLISSNIPAKDPPEFLLDQQEDKKPPRELTLESFEVRQELNAMKTSIEDLRYHVNMLHDSHENLPRNVDISGEQAFASASL